MRRVFLFVCLLYFAIPNEAFAQRHSPHGVAVGWRTDISRTVLAQFRGAQIARLGHQSGIRHTQVRVDFVVLKNGRVESAQVTQSSGNPAFDQRIERIVRSMRLPPIPTMFKDERVKFGQVVSFH